MRRVASYQAAIDWIVDNDDNEWLRGEEGDSESVALCLVADIFYREIKDATADLRRALAKRRREAA